MSKQSQFYKSVRSGGGGLFSKGINQLNATVSHFNPERPVLQNQNMSDSEEVEKEEAEANAAQSYLVLEQRHTFNHKMDSHSNINFSHAPYMNSCKEVLEHRYGL